MNQLFSDRHSFRATAFGCSFTVFGKAESGGSKTYTPNARTKVRDSNDNVHAWKQEIGIVAGTLRRGKPPYEGPLYLKVVFYRKRPKWHTGVHGIKKSAPKFPDTKPDTTKLIRPLEDALTGILWNDDAQVVRQYAEKRWVGAGEEERVEVEVVLIV